jgi:hypothetical protein
MTLISDSITQGVTNPMWVFSINTCGHHRSSNMNNHENTNASRFCHFCCCAADTISSRSSTCICYWESRSSELLSSAILHRERMNKIFGKRSSRLLARFIKFFTTAHLPFRRSRAEGCRLQHELRQANRHLHPVIVIKEPQVTYGSCSQIMSYIFSVLSAYI